MVEQIDVESVYFENARRFHENYLLKFQNSDLQDAIENYVEVLNINPDKAECYYRLASLMYESGQITLESTIEQCKKAIFLNPKNINAYLYAGYYLEQAQDFISAEEVIKKAIKLSELKSARARLILADLLKKKMHLKGLSLWSMFQYIYYFTTGCVAIFGDFSVINMFLKCLKDNFGIFAFKTIGKILEKLNSQKAIDFYKFAKQKTEQQEIFYDKIAQVYIKNNEIEKALGCYKNSLKVNSENKNTVYKMAALTQKYYPESIDTIIEYYSLLLELEDIEKLPSIYYELGHLYLQKNDKINSVSAFKLALVNNEDNPYYNEALAYAYYQAELYDDAIEYYQRAIKLNPDRLWTVNVCYTLGLIYQNYKQNYEAAIASFQAGAILDSKNENVLLALADVYGILKDYDSAIKTYKDVISINPRNYEAYSKLGLTFYSVKNIQEALEAYEKSLEINSEYEVVYNNLAVMYIEDIKDYDMALKFLKKAISINPNYTFAYFNMGRVFQKQGNYSDAAQNYQMAYYLNKITNVFNESEIQTKMEELFNL